MPQTICLTMIVKDEAHVIERCLAAVRPFVTHWLIVDTGSSDGTQDLVRSLLSDLPGELVQRPWRDFGHNRTEALELARPSADYSLIIDADEVFTAPDGFSWPVLVEDVYSLRHQHGSYSYWVARLVDNRLPWRYTGVLHEFLECPGAGEAVELHGPVIHGRFDGGRSVGLTTEQKYTRDAITLEQALQREPDNPRYQYYLGRSYQDSGHWGRALQAYARRAQMGGFEEEVYDSLHSAAYMHELIGSPMELVLSAYLAAFERRPTRAESLCALARYCREHEHWELARLFATRAMQIPRPNDVLFVDEDVYSWRCRDEYAIACYWSGDYAESARVASELLSDPALPDEQRERVEMNLRFAESKLTG